MARFMNLDDGMRQNYKELFNPLQNMTDLELYKRYRFDRDTIIWITNRLRGALQKNSNRNRPISPELQVLAALSYMASDTFQIVVGDTFNMSQASVSRSVTAVVDSICELLFPEKVYFPETDEELSDIRNGFYGVAGFPNVVGCLDGTHIRLIAPKDREHDFVNRKSYHSLNVMACCDHLGRFRHVLAKYPGSSHDSFVLRDSNLWDGFEYGHLRGNMLGDSAYPSRRWLYIPYPNTVTAPQQRYNQ